MNLETLCRHWGTTKSTHTVIRRGAIIDPYSEKKNRYSYDLFVEVRTAINGKLTGLMWSIGVPVIELLNRKDRL